MLEETPAVAQTTTDSIPQKPALPQAAHDNPSVPEQQQGSEKEAEKEVVKRWHDEFDKDLHLLFEKHGVKEYIFCFKDPMTDRPSLVGRSISGEIYPIAKLAAAALRRLKAQVDTELEA